jgi:uncharacterized protein (TIGR03663 family)
MTTTGERLRTFWGDRQVGSGQVPEMLTRYWEIALYGAIMSIALAMRFWHLDDRAIHHDESLHMYYAWQLFKGQGYEHVPFMHGPLKFFGTAVMFRLFGDNDFTARMLYAIVGSALVGLPYFLRSYLGRIGAIVAALLLAFSPSLLYVSRFNRDDILIVAYTLAMVVVMWRYLKEQQEKYLYLVPLILMLGFTTMEMTFITTAIFLVYLEYQLANDLLDQYRASRTLTPVETAVAYAIFLAIGWLLAILWPLFETPRKRWGLETMPAAGNFMVVMVIFSLPQFAATVQKIPLIHLGTSNTYDEGTAHQNLKIITTLSFLFIAAYIGLFWNWRIFLIGAAIFYIPYVLLYTTFFTNPGGFWTGMWGSLDYWLSQQLVRRGNQPDYYYLMMAPIYEFLPLIFALGGALYYAFKGKLDQVLLSTAILLLVLVFSLIPGDAPLIGSWWKLSFVVAIGGVLFLRMDSFTKFLLFWSLSSVFALSIAGEKMPWLIVHVALPLIILSAKIIDDVLSNVGQAVQQAASAVEEKTKRRTASGEEDAPTSKPMTPLGLERYWPFVAAGALAVIATVIFQKYGPGSTLSIVAWLLSLGALGVAVWVARSGAWRMAGQVAAVGLFAALFVFTVRAAGYAAYDQGNVGSYPQEALIYAQGSPALNVLRDDISDLAATSGQGTDLQVVIDQTGNIWPWPWILRNHKGYRGSSFEEGFTPPANAVVFVSTQNQAKMQPYLADYVDGIPYTHMWWFPEFYRGLDRSNFLSDVFHGKLFGTWRRYFIDREVHGATAAPDMIAYFPKGSKITPPPGNVGTVNSDPFPADQVTLIGGPGAGPSQFSSPLDMTLDAQGNLYVVDSLNHRVQKVAPDGTAQTFGEQGSDKGQFANPHSADYDVNDGPWGIAVDEQGNIYVADTWNHRIQKFGPDFKYTNQWGTGQLFGPRDIAIDGQGNVLVVDTGNKKIRKYDADGRLIEEHGREGGGNGQFQEPSSVAVAPNGDIFVADYWNKRIQRFDSSFVYISEIKVSSWGSHGVSDRAYIQVLSDGRILATDPANGRIIVFNPQGEVERSWRLPAPGGTSRPIGIVADADNVYISDSLASTVVKVPLAWLLAPPPATPEATAAATAAATAGGTP